MSKVETYRQKLRNLEDWDEFLLAESRLPGPRANLELARAVAQEGDQELFGRYLELDAESAPTNTPFEFLACCGVLGLGKLLAEGDVEALQALRRFASDPRWRIREMVAMALQHFGKSDMDTLLQEMDRWSHGGALEQRAAAAALCEPNLLDRRDRVERVLEILDTITASAARTENRRSDEFRALRKGLGYCWSVATVACPEKGKPMMERWLASDDPDVRWIMKQNLKKRRLQRMDAEWVAAWRSKLDMG